MLNGARTFDVLQITTKISINDCCLGRTRFRENFPKPFCVIQLTNRQTNRPRRWHDLLCVGDNVSVSCQPRVEHLRRLYWPYGLPITQTKVSKHLPKWSVWSLIELSISARVSTSGIPLMEGRPASSDLGVQK